MIIPFEAKYIQVHWINKNTVDYIYESRDAIEIQKIDNSSYKVEAITYSKIEKNKSGQLAFRVLNDTYKSQPYMINAKGEKITLLSVIDNKTGKEWWIENGTLRGSFIDSKFHRTAGHAKMFFGNFNCKIEIGSLTFTYEELNQYLKDFKSDLWGLVLKEDSYVFGEIKSKKLKSAKMEWVEKIDQFIVFVENILKNPKKELTREYALQNANKVRPVQKTFIEILTKGATSKYLTGQSHTKSLNITENKYIHALIDRLLVLVGNEINISNKRILESEKELQSLNEQIKNIDNMLNSNSIKIDENVIEYYINELEKQVNQEQYLLDKALLMQNHQMNIYPLSQKRIIIRLGMKTKNEYLYEFFGDIKYTLEDEYISFKSGEYKDSFCMLAFDKGIFDNKLKTGYEYEIIGYIEEKDIQKESGIGFKLKRKIKYISEIKIIKSLARERLFEYKSKKMKLEKLNWNLNNDENNSIYIAQLKKEQNDERKALIQSKNLLLDENAYSKDLYVFLISTQSKLKKLKKQFIDKKIHSKHIFPASMTFVQNPQYQGAHKIYKQIINKSGLDDDLFKSLEVLEKIGILDIPKVYERWCLLQIIKVLRNKFHFIPQEKNWKSILTEQIFVKDPKNIELKFKNDHSEREIVLTYEKELIPNGRRPDFVLDIDGRIGKNYRFIMDAKFMEEIDISEIIDDLYNEKNYAENGNNKVFILHPSKKAVPKMKTPQKWAKNSYYGETKMFDWDNDNPNHKYGAILLSPIQKQGIYLDDLKRLIGMFLQYGMEDNHNIRTKNRIIDPIPKEKMFCIACGSTKHTAPNPILAGKSKNNYKYQITCLDCSHMTIYSYCGNCGNRLIKNGSYWTYHATEALEPINIKCPFCGDLL